MSFRFNARAAFLTYPKCDGRKEDLVEFLDALDPKPTDIAACQEEHKDGTKHLHALIRYGAKVNIKNARHWDWNGHHPNVGPVRNQAASLKYLQKEDGEPIIRGFIDVGGGSHGGRGGDGDGKYIELARSGMVSEAIEEFSRQHPRDYVINKTRCEENLRAMSKKPKRLTYSLDQFQEAAEGWDRRLQALLLYGATGTGKTEYAKALIGEGYLLIRHMDQLKELTSETTGIIFDDMSFFHWPRESCIHLLDLNNDSGINVKHGCVTIPAGLPRIFTSNFDRHTIFPVDTAGAIDRRLFVTDYLDEPIFEKAE